MNDASEDWDGDEEQEECDAATVGMRSLDPAESLHPAGLYTGHTDFAKPPSHSHSHSSQGQSTAPSG